VEKKKLGLSTNVDSSFIVYGVAAVRGARIEDFIVEQEWLCWAPDSNIEFHHRSYCSNVRFSLYNMGNGSTIEVLCANRNIPTGAIEANVLS
jgi:hypothetical protein